MTQKDLDDVVRADSRRSRLFALLLALAFLAIATATVVMTVFVAKDTPRTSDASALIFAAFCLVAAAVAPAVVLVLHRMRCRHWRRRQRECEELADVVLGIEDKALGKLVVFNFRLMDRFTSVALAQARASFLACTIAGAAALLVILTGTAVVMAAGSIAGQVTAGVLTAAGATLSGLLSGGISRSV